MRGSRALALAWLCLLRLPCAPPAWAAPGATRALRSEAGARDRRSGPARLRIPERFDPRRERFWQRPAPAAPLVVGSAALDTIQTPTGTRYRLLGGSAIYASAAAATASVSRPLLVAPVGNDFPDGHVEKLRTLGVDTRGLDRQPGPTFSWTGRYGANLKDRETVQTQLGVLESFRPRLPPGFRPKFVFLANMSPEQQSEALAQLPRGGAGAHVLVDTMNMWIRSHRPALERVLHRADLLLVNDEEARLLGGTDDLAAAARNVLALGPQMVIVKQGGQGATLHTRVGQKMRSFQVPAFPVRKVVDTTGAGDSYAGALTAYLARTDRFDVDNVRRGMIFASAVASSTVEDFSLDGLERLTREDLMKRFDQVAAEADRTQVSSARGVGPRRPRRPAARHPRPAAAAPQPQTAARPAQSQSLAPAR